MSPAAHVTSLQQDIIKLGFRFFDAPTGTFHQPTQWAVRELQIYAKMARAAKEDTKSTAAEYADRLSPVDNTGDGLYAGPVSGVVNAATRKVIETWLKEDRRCPVVIDAWDKAIGGGKTDRNIWRHDEVKVAIRHAKALDMSDYYAPYKPGDLELFAQIQKSDWGYGPLGNADTSPASMEVLPESALGSPWASLSADFQSTFKVIRCIAEIECYAFFDVINAYDGEIVSGGLVHWTLGSKGTGELCEYLTGYAASSPADYQRAFTFFGFDPRPQRTGDSPAVRVQKEDGSFDVLGTSADKLNYMRNWHWLYRFVMASRTFESYRRRMWVETVARLAKIRNAPLEVTNLGTKRANNVITYPTIGQVFTSELAMGILLRWDVIAPERVLKGKRRADESMIPGKAYDKARTDAPSLDWSSDLSKWTQANEDALVEALRAMAEKGNAQVKATIPMVFAFPRAHPRWKMDRTVITALSKVRGSFRLASGAPSASPPAQQPPAAPPPSTPPPSSPPAAQK